MSNNPTVSIRRRSSMSGVVRRFKVFVDDVNVGVVGNGQTKHFELSPGRHILYVALDLYRSKPCVVNVQLGEAIQLVCGLKGGLSGALSAFTSPHDYLQLEPDAATPQSISQPQHPVNPALQDPPSTVHLNEREVRVPAAIETIHVPKGVTVKVKRSRSVEHTVEVDWNVVGSAQIDAGFKAILSGSIKGEISKKQGRSTSETEEMEYEVELDGKECNQYQLSWTDVWRDGTVEFMHEGRSSVAQFRYHERAELDVVQIRQG